MALKVEWDEVRLVVGVNYRVGFWMEMWANRRKCCSIAPVYLDSERREGDWVPVVVYSLGGVDSHAKIAADVRRARDLKGVLERVMVVGGMLDFELPDGVVLTFLRSEGPPGLPRPYTILGKVFNGKGLLVISLTAAELQAIYVSLVDYFGLDYLIPIAADGLAACLPDWVSRIPIDGLE